jgi:hypothetical protein
LEGAVNTKRFFYVCAGLFLLVAAYTMGARNATADFPGSGGHVVGLAADYIGSSSGYLLRSDGTIWFFSRTDGGGVRQVDECAALPPSIPTTEIALWSGNSLVTKSGVVWTSGYCPDGWSVLGTVPPPPTVSVEGNSMSYVKGAYRK